MRNQKHITKQGQVSQQPQQELDQNRQQSDNQESQSEYSSEDQDGLLLTNKVQSKLLSVVAMLKNKSSQLYNIDKPIFQDNDFQGKLANKVPDQKKKKLTYKDMMKKNVGSDSQQQDNNISVDKIKESFKSKLNKSKIDSDQDMFKVKEKLSINPTIENKNNAEKVSDFLQQTFKEANDDRTKQMLANLWTDNSKLDETDKFLRNYILDKKWVSSKYLTDFNDQAMIDQEDEERSLEMDNFEAQYNFRYEEPDGNKIIQYPRDVPESIRVKPQTRKEKRKKAEQRKKQEQIELRKQAQRKKQQVKEKIVNRMNQQQKLKRENQMIDENEEISEDCNHDWFFCDDCTKPLEENQLHYVCGECEDYMLCEQCFDLIIHKHQMFKSVIPKGAGPPVSQKAAKRLQRLKSCRDCHRKIPDALKRYEYTDKASYITSNLCQKCYDETNLSTKKKFKEVQARVINYQQLVDKNPQKIKELTSQKDIEELVDQYIKNDFEDVLAGGLKTKFRYLSVKPESYGLSDEQILFGDDKQLNKYVSIKKLAPYRDNDQPMKLRNNVYSKKIKNIQKSMENNKKVISKSGNKGASGLKNLNKMKSRSEILRKRRQNLKKKLKLVNLSRKEDQDKYFIPKSRLQSYGLTANHHKTG